MDDEEFLHPTQYNAKAQRGGMAFSKQEVREIATYLNNLLFAIFKKQGRGEGLRDIKEEVLELVKELYARDKRN